MAKRTLTTGQYNAYRRMPAARACNECDETMPRYAGRYPKKCHCGGEVCTPKSEVEVAVCDVIAGEPTDEVVEGLMKNKYSEQDSILV